MSIFLLFVTSFAFASPEVGSTIMMPTKVGYAFGTTTNASIGKVQLVQPDGRLVVDWDTPPGGKFGYPREIPPQTVRPTDVLAEVAADPAFRRGKHVVLVSGSVDFLGTLERAFEKNHHEIRWQNGMWWWGPTSVVPDENLFVEDDADVALYPIGTRLQRRWYPHSWGTVLATYTGRLGPSVSGGGIKVLWENQKDYGTDADYIPLQLFDCVYMNRPELCSKESLFRRKRL